MNNRPKQMIVDMRPLSKGLVDWAHLHGIVIVSRIPDRRDKVDGRAVHQTPDLTDCSLTAHGSRGDRKGQIERTHHALQSAFQRRRRHDK
jgi:hypothetical protein